MSFRIVDQHGEPLRTFHGEPHTYTTRYQAEQDLTRYASIHTHKVVPE